MTADAHRIASRDLAIGGLHSSIWHLAIPMTLEMIVLNVSMTLDTYWMGQLGEAAVAAVTVSMTNRLLMFVVIPTFGLGNACGALVGQNPGAGKPQRAEKTAWWVSGYAAMYTILIVLFVVLLAPTLINFFVKDPTAEVMDLGIEYLYSVAPSLIAMAVAIVLGRGFDGAGNTVPAMIVNLLTLWGVKVGFAYALSRWFDMGATGVWWARSMAGFANGLLFAVWFWRGKWKEQAV